MSSLQILQGMFRPSNAKTLQLDASMLSVGDGWVFVGSNSSGKSALAHVLAGELSLLKGERRCQFIRITRLSLEQLQKLASNERQRDNTDLLSPSEDDSGHTTIEITRDGVHDLVRCTTLAQQPGISSLLNKCFKCLSTDETRRTLFC